MGAARGLADGRVRFVGWLDRWLGSGRPAFDGTTGRPPSGNGASSFHLYGDLPAGHWVGAEAVIEVVEPPAVDALYFWALQVNFVDRGRETGGAHFGLQQFSAHPGGTAVNWGGYRTGGGELPGSVSALPSGPGNVNTRDYHWVAGRRYRYRVVACPGEGREGTTAWRGSITDLESGEETVVRDLWAAGDRIAGPMMWSEVFAACDDPSVMVRWSDVSVIGADGSPAPVTSFGVNYQSRADGGCAITDSTVSADGQAIEQRTNTPRTTPQGARLVLRPPR